MKKPLLLSLVASSIITNNLDAASMYERFEAMEKEIAALKTEISDLKGDESTMQSQQVEEEDDSEEEDSDDAEDEDEDESDDSEDDGDDAEDDGSEDEGDDAGDDEGDDEDDDDDEPSFEEETEDSLEYFDKAVTQLKKDTTGNHLKFTADLRSSVENIQYKMAADQMIPQYDDKGNVVGTTNRGDTFGNDAMIANRLWLNMNWAASKNLSFTAQLAYNKLYGGRSGINGFDDGSYETFDWITNENAYDGTLRVRSAYWFYRNATFLGMNIPWTFSIGRRPSTNGHLINFRDDEKAASPSGHSINVEFDGISSKFTLDEDWGTYVKFCMGRGLSNAQPRFSSTPYAKDENHIDDIDLAGFIFVPYNSGSVELFTQFYYANNLIDAKNPMAQTQGFETVGGLYSGTAALMIEGLGDWSDFSDDSIFFISGAFSTTNPDKKYDHATPNSEGEFNYTGMLGSETAQTGYSVWAGIQTPMPFTDEGRFGLEYNWGSQYWRAITYGEDTNIGSKVAARGSAYEAYYTQQLMKGLSFQLRFTYIDYGYTGSNGFFGDTSGRSVKLDQAVSEGWGGYAVDTAQDARAYIRYRF